MGMNAIAKDSTALISYYHALFYVITQDFDPYPQISK